MTAASFSKDMTRLIDLTDFHFQKVDKGLRVSIAERWFRTTRLYYKLSRSVREFEEMTRRQTDDAIWFEGLSKKFWQDNSDVRPYLGELVPRLESLKTDVLAGHAELLKVQGWCTKLGSHAAAKAAGSASAGAAQLYEALENFRWTLLELEANHSKVSESYVATSKDEVDALFARIAAEA